MIPLGRDEMRANISFFAGGVDFVGVDFCENHPTLYLVPAKWDHKKPAGYAVELVLFWSYLYDERSERVIGYMSEVNESK